MSLKKKFQNIPPSWRAIRLLWSEELSFRVLAICGAIVMGLAYFFGVTVGELLILLIVIGTVLAVEALNTAVEELCDHVTPHEHPHIGKVKDIASGATLLILITALVIGLIIFVPYMQRLV